MKNYLNTYSFKSGLIEVREVLYVQQKQFIPTEDHKRLKALAAVLGKSMREIVSDWIHGNLYSENIPNAENQYISALLNVKLQRPKNAV